MPTQKNVLKISGFTFVEALVLIAILLVLMALFLPALKNTVVEGKLMSCLNNMRQQGMAYDAYAGDWGGSLPNGSYQDWQGPILGMNSADIFNGVAKKKYLIDPYSNGDADVWTCTDFPTHGWLLPGGTVNQWIAQGGGYGHALLGARQTLSFGILYCIRGLNSPNPAPSWAMSKIKRQVNAKDSNGLWVYGATTLRQKSIPEPSKSIMLLEMFPEEGGLYPSGATYGYFGGYARHNGTPQFPYKGNVLYADGHGKTTNQFWGSQIFRAPGQGVGATDTNNYVFATPWEW